LAAETPDFAKDIAPLLTKYCAGCHNDTDREGKLSLASYDALLKGGAKGGVLTPGQADASRLVRVLTGQAEPKMPPEGEEAPKAAEIELLKAWITAGAKGPSGTGPDPTLLVTPQIKLLAPAKLPINAIAASPAGDVLAIARHGEVELVSLPDRQPLHKLAGIRGSVNGVAFSHDGQLIVAAAGEAGLFGEARLFKVSDGSLIREFRGHKDSLYSAVLSPDGALLATGGYDSSIKLWNVADGTELRSLDGHNGAVFELAFRPDGKVLASASGDRTVKLWNVATGQRLDTLKESQKELYTLAFSPDGSRLAAAGVDNRIRVWQITADAKEGTNPLQTSKFAHETPVLRIVWSADGRTLASCGEDRLVKLWNAETMTIRQTLAKQPDWASGLAIGGKNDLLAVARIDGSLTTYPLASTAPESEQPLVPLAEVPPEVDYGPQPATDQLPKIVEVEPNALPEQATALAVPGVATGKVALEGASQKHEVSDASQKREDADLFRFDAKVGDQWIIETKAARSSSPLDSKIEVLDSAGRPVPRLLLRAVRDSVIEFRGMNGDQRGVRLANWDEMLLNEYVYLSGEVIKHFQARRGPDADAQFYPEGGSRIAYFDTTCRAHALGEPGYVVVPYAVGTALPNNGLPVFTVNFENDDDAARKLGKDSRLTFVAPADGSYLVRVTDVRGFGGDSFSYELSVRRPLPDFKVTLTGNNPTVGAGSGKPFTVKAERIDNYSGPIRIDIAGLPPGWSVTTPLMITEGMYEAYGAIYADATAVAPTEDQLKAIKVTATATVCGQERTHDVNSLGTIKLAEKPKVIAFLEPVGQASSLPENTADSAGKMPAPLITITPGGTVTLKLHVERTGFDGRIAFEAANLPHGIIVDDIGLSGVLVREKETERAITLRAESWVPEQERTFYATAQVEGNQSTRPLVIRVQSQ
jgi:WD40 repeat protein